MRGSTRIAPPVGRVNSLECFKFPVESGLSLFSFLFEPFDTFCQLRQARRPGELLLEFLERPRGSPPNDLSATNRFPRQNAGLRTNHRTIFDQAMIAQPRLAPKGHILPNHRRS